MNRSGSFSLVVCGGAALNAMRLIQRTTKDVHIVALMDSSNQLVDPAPLPEELLVAAKEVADTLNLPQDWLNNGPSSGDGGLFRLGLPDGFKDRLVKNYQGEKLTVYLISRLDQIYFKLYAAIDQFGSYHASDLKQLLPSDEELLGAELLGKKASCRLKWSGLSKKYYQKQKESLFFDKDGNALPCPPGKDANSEFLNHGLKRGQINLRGYSQGFDLQSPACLLLRLRALLGINARAEVLCLLASLKETHPSEAARATTYYQKTIQTTLVEMAQSGAILTRTSKKEKFYRLKPDTLDTLLKPDGESPSWVNWPALLKAVEIIWRKLCELSKQELDSLLLYSELKKLMHSVSFR